MVIQSPSKKEDTIHACGYAARKAKGELSPFSFERRRLGSKDILIEILNCAADFTVRLINLGRAIVKSIKEANYQF